MKLKIRDLEEKKTKVLEIFLKYYEDDSDEICIMSQVNGEDKLYEFTIRPDKSWRKETGGNLQNKPKWKK